MASSAALPVMDAVLAQAARLTTNPTLHCDMSPPRVESILIKDASKRKRVNRNAKLKQCKLDARREQWLSQVNNKHGKTDQGPENDIPLAEENKDEPGEVVHPEEHSALERAECRHPALQPVERTEATAPRSHLRIKRLDDCDKETPSNNSLGTEELSSPTNSCTSDCSEADSSPKSFGDDSPKSKVTRRGRDLRGGRDMQINNKVGKGSCDTERRREGGKEKINSDSCSKTSGSTRYESGFVDESGHGVDSEDDWEAAADALDLKPTREKAPNPRESSNVGEKNGILGLQSVAAFTEATGNLKPEFRTRPNLQMEMSRSCNGRAWRPDDICRPTSLPSLSKQQSLPAHVGCQLQRFHSELHPRNLTPVPIQCPICTEELDSTDSDFYPCSCDFRLCLFCYHRIVSEDGRCPGCRKFYCADLQAKPTLSSTLRRTA